MGAREHLVRNRYRHRSWCHYNAMLCSDIFNPSATGSPLSAVAGSVPWL
jgi:hypothetical protein